MNFSLAMKIECCNKLSKKTYVKNLKYNFFKADLKNN